MAHQNHIKPALPQQHVVVRLLAWILLPFSIVLALNSPDIATNITTIDAVTTVSDVELLNLIDDVGVDLGHDGDHEDDSSTTQLIELALIGERYSLPLPCEVHSRDITLYVLPLISEPHNEIFVPPPVNVS
ncbi:MAG TPA: hypothetical protein DIS79_08425 [Bacteroidetes bacterium]|nr:hypothetical protein [Bacteroidota bacterium]HRK03710.1 hypothetical protein [Chlorobiota bacterium]